jgi:diaphanous 1
VITVAVTDRTHAAFDQSTPAFMFQSLLDGVHTSAAGAAAASSCAVSAGASAWTPQVNRERVQPTTSLGATAGTSDRRSGRQLKTRRTNRPSMLRNRSVLGGSRSRVGDTAKAKEATRRTPKHGDLKAHGDDEGEEEEEEDLDNDDDEEELEVEVDDENEHAQQQHQKHTRQQKQSVKSSTQQVLRRQTTTKLRSGYRYERTCVGEDEALESGASDGRKSTRVQRRRVARPTAAEVYGEHDQEVVVARSPVEFLELMHVRATPRVLRALFAALLSGDALWQKTFLDLAGLVKLLDVISRHDRKYHKSNLDLTIQVEAVRCVKALLKSQAGVDALLSDGNFLGVLSLTMDADHVQLRRKAPKIMATLGTLSPLGHTRVLEALSYFRTHKSERLRFTKMVHSLASVEDLRYRTHVFSLINVIVNSPYHSLQDRLMLR